MALPVEVWKTSDGTDLVWEKDDQEFDFGAAEF